MNASKVITEIQDILGIPLGKQAPHVGPLTRTCIDHLAALGPDDDYQFEFSPASVRTVGSVLPQAKRLLSAAGEDLIKSFEGLVLVGADDGFGNPTIGWGHTGLQHNDGTVFIGRRISKEEAEALFQYDMTQFENLVCANVTVDLSQNQFDALVSFDFNTGELKKSTLLKYVNLKQWINAADEFLKWNHVDGKVVTGLTRRRAAERTMFIG